jgi:hypothetical protein
MDMNLVANELAKVAKALGRVAGRVEKEYDESRAGFELYIDLKFDNQMGVAEKTVTAGLATLKSEVTKALGSIRLGGSYEASVGMPSLNDGKVYLDAKPFGWYWSGMMSVDNEGAIDYVRDDLEAAGFKPFKPR